MVVLKQHTVEITPEVIRLYVEEKLTLAAIGHRINRSDSIVFSILKRNNIEMRGHASAHNTLKINKDVFKNHPHRAYWCGLLLADGHVGSDVRRDHSYYIRIALNIKDEHILHEFRSFLEYDGKVKYSNNNTKCYLSINSEEIYNDLQELSVTSDKTFNAQIPDLLKMDPLFWRGVIDGDGCIRAQNNKIRINLGSASKSMVDDFRIFGLSISPTSTANVGVMFTRDLTPFYRITFGGEHAIRILEKLYESEGPKLIRKFDVAKEYMYAMV